MSTMLCSVCDRLVDTDSDPDSLYVETIRSDCVCKACRDVLDLKTEFDEDERDPSELEHELDQLSRYTAHQEELERGYVGPKADRT